ncbi:MAG: 3'-5' exonuclease [Campylobacterota bacterium]|nr:3'-5' exonuclease [Campylobacterota bacterium]
MNYIDKLSTSLNKSPLRIEKFNKILENNDTFFENIELEKELLLSNGFPLYFTDDLVYLKSTITNIKEQTFCIVDIETNAPNVSEGQIIEIGAIKLKNNQIIEEYQSLVNVSQISPFIQEITGITPDMTHNSPSLKTVLEEFKIFLEDDIFVAHNISFDYKFISDSLKKYDLGELYNRKLCTINLSQRIINAQRYGLKYLAKELNINIDEHHRALNDAYVTTKILKHCLSRLPKNIKNVEELITFSK